MLNNWEGISIRGLIFYFLWNAAISGNMLENINVSSVNLFSAVNYRWMTWNDDIKITECLLSGNQHHFIIQISFLTLREFLAT